MAVSEQVYTENGKKMDVWSKKKDQFAPVYSIISDSAKKVVNEGNHFVSSCECVGVSLTTKTRLARNKITGHFAEKRDKTVNGYGNSALARNCPN